jgi:hypothetical protein
MATTTTTKKVHTIKEIHEETDWLVQRATKQFNDAKAAMLDSMATNPESAIRWSAEDLVKSQFTYTAVTAFQGMVRKADVVTAIDWLIDHLENKVSSFFGSSSTSQFCNAIARAEADAAHQLLREWTATRTRWLGR